MTGDSYYVIRDPYPRGPRRWWIFAMPGSTVAVPAETEAAAREHMRENQYKDAPVYAYPCLCAAICSLREMHRVLAQVSKQRGRLS